MAAPDHLQGVVMLCASTASGSPSEIPRALGPLVVTLKLLLMFTLCAIMGWEWGQTTDN